MLQSLLLFVRRFTASNTSFLTIIGGSNPRGSGFQPSRAKTLVVTSDFLAAVETALPKAGDATVVGGVGGGIDVMPAQDDGADVGLTSVVRSINFSGRNIFSNLRVRRPMADSSRTIGGPSSNTTLFRSSCVITSSRNGAYPLSNDIPSKSSWQL